MNEKIDFDRREILEGLLKGLSIDDDKKFYFLSQKILGEATSLGQANSPSTFLKMLDAFEKELQTRGQEVVTEMRRALSGANISDFNRLDQALLELSFNTLLPCFNAANQQLDKYRPTYPSIKRQHSVADIRRTTEKLAPEISLLCAQVEAEQAKRVVFRAGEVFSANKALRAILTKAKKCIDIIDSYPGTAVFDLLELTDSQVRIRWICGRELKNAVKTTYLAFRAQYRRCELRTLPPGQVHDRYIILDATTVLHSGHSLHGMGSSLSELSEVSDPNIVTEFERLWSSGQPVI
jgi:hypothetical protein